MLNMIEVDSLRRGYSFGHYDQSYVIGAPNPFHGALGTAPTAAPIPDNHRMLIHWNQPETTRQPTTTDTNKSGEKSEEDEDDDDEDRPFTPPPPRERLSYTRYQLELLNGIYNEVRYPNSTQKQLIAKRVGITREQVKIWFQNRRRKDVVGNSGKTKSCDTSTSSTGSHDSERHQSPMMSEADSSTSDDSILTKRDSPEPPKDDEECVVPSVVMKSIIGELLKFINDPLKGRKNKKKAKKAKQKQKDKEKLKKGIATTLLAGSYDMVSPPNQIVPHAFFEKIKSGFNHSKNTSAFANPRVIKGSPQISNIFPTPEHSPPDITLRDASHVNKTSSATFMNTNMFPFSTQAQSHMFPSPTSYPPQGPITGSEIPVLSDLLGYRSPHDRKKNPPPPPTTSLPTPVTSHMPPHQVGSHTDRDKSFSAMNSFNAGRPLNGIFPYPFLAEQPMFMSSLRQPDHILRPSPHYPPAHFSDDPYQPLLISSYPNPYFPVPTSTSWASTGSGQNPPSSVYASGI